MAVFAGQRLTASVLNGLVSPDTWHGPVTLVNSWGGAGGNVNGLYYRLTVNNEVEVIADITNASATGNSVCYTLPAGYLPAVGQNHEASWNNPQSSNSASAPWVNVGTSGSIQLTGIESAGHNIFFHIFIPLGTL